MEMNDELYEVLDAESIILGRRIEKTQAKYEKLGRQMVKLDRRIKRLKEFMYAVDQELRHCRSE